jgi:hypothetical protein
MAKTTKSRLPSDASGPSGSGSSVLRASAPLSVFRSSLHMYAQVIDDDTGTTLGCGLDAEPRDPR